MIVGLVGRRAEVIAQSQVQSEPIIHFPVILNVRGDVLEVVLARIARRVRVAEGGGLKDAGARIVAEQEVRNRVAGESAVEGEIAEKIGGQISPELPAPVIDADVR